MTANTDLDISLKHTPILDPDFVPAALWNKEFKNRANVDGRTILIGLEKSAGNIHIEEHRILPESEENNPLNLQYVERHCKFLLWQIGGNKILIAGAPEVATSLSSIYSLNGARAFDADFIGNKIYDKSIEVEACDAEKLNGQSNSESMPLGRNLDGYRIGFDLGGSDRKCAAVDNGKVVFSEEIAWDPYFQEDFNYHLDGIMDSLKRAAEHLPQVDAIGGSAAGVYVENQVRAGSLFRGIPEKDFEPHVRNIFFEVQKRWDNVPFEVVNDGEVTALAGSMSLEDNGVLGIAMGTSEAVGYVDMDGHIRPWLNELAFAPVDYRANGPVDEWSGDQGCGVQYFSQQAVGRLLSAAGIETPTDMGLPEKLVEVQKLMEAGDDRAKKIYETIGVYFGYSIAHYADFYDFKYLLILGRVTSGEGGEIIIQKAEEVLQDEFPELAKKIALKTPSEQDKRHGQAIAAASLPSIK